MNLITIISLALTLVVLIAKYLKYDKKIIFYYAKKKKPWAINAANRIINEFQQEEIKRKIRRKNKFIKRADELSKSRNGMRIYVFEDGGDFVLRDNHTAKQWAKSKFLPKTTILTDICVYYTPQTRLTTNN